MEEYLQALQIQREKEMEMLNSGWIYLFSDFTERRKQRMKESQYLKTSWLRIFRTGKRPKLKDSGCTKYPK